MKGIEEQAEAVASPCAAIEGAGILNASYDRR